MAGKRRRNNFILQGGILGMAGILTRIIGMLYRIPVTNIIGPEGNGYYAAAFQVYTVMLLISSYSLPLAVSKLVSARLSRGEYKNADRIFKAALGFAFSTGGVVCILLFIFAGDFATHLMSEPLSAIALRIFAPTLLIVAVMGVIRGYFQGMGTMIPTAVSQIIEQIVNAIVSIMAANYLVEYGSKAAALLRNESLKPAYGAAGSTIGTSSGALAGLIFLIIALLLVSRGLYDSRRIEKKGFAESYGGIVRILIITIIPVILSTAIYNISELLANSIFNKVMVAKGFAREKSYIWGVYSGEYKILLNVPIALSNAMSASVVPTLTAAIAENNIKAARRKISQAMRFTMIVAFPCAAGLCALAMPIMQMLFKDGFELAAGLMHFGCINIIFYSVSTLSNGILQGLGKMNIPVRNACISLVIHLMVLYSLLSYTNLGIYSVIAANFCFAFSMSFLNQLSVRKLVRYRIDFGRVFVTPGICAVIMGVMCFVSEFAMSFVLPLMVRTIISIIIGAAIYCLLLVKLGGISEDEIRVFPMGKSIAGLLRSFHIL